MYASMALSRSTSFPPPSSLPPLFAALPPPLPALLAPPLP